MVVVNARRLSSSRGKAASFSDIPRPPRDRCSPSPSRIDQPLDIVLALPAELAPAGIIIRVAGQGPIVQLHIEQIFERDAFDLLEGPTLVCHLVDVDDQAAIGCPGRFPPVVTASGRLSIMAQPITSKPMVAPYCCASWHNPAKASTRCGIGAAKL